MIKPCFHKFCFLKVSRLFCTHWNIIYIYSLRIFNWSTTLFNYAFNNVNDWLKKSKTELSDLYDYFRMDEKNKDYQEIENGYVVTY